MNQLSLPQMAPSRQLEYWAGYSFGMPLCDQWKWCSGVVFTPRWAKRVRRECRGLPLMLDNGAFAAWRDGVDLDFDQHVESLHVAINEIGEVPDRIILPDIVAGGSASLVRSMRAIDDLAQYGKSKMWLPVQEGMDINLAMGVASDLGGIFVGGATKEWKIQITKWLRNHNRDIKIHVGRLSKPHELAEAIYAGASSFDTTTFMRQQTINKHIKWHNRFRLCVEQAIMGDLIILLSGGPNSVALLEHAKNNDINVACALFVDYGQPSKKKEYRHAMRAAQYYGVRLEVRKVQVGLGDMAEGKGVEVVPVRNAILCTIAANLAASCGANSVMIGAVASDAVTYADCTEKYIESLNTLTSPFCVSVMAPWVNTSHKEVGRLVPIELETWSCYRLGEEPCLECPACRARIC